MSVVYVTEHGAYIRKKEGRFIVSQQDGSVHEIPEHTLESFVISGSVQVTSQAMMALLQLGVPLNWLSHGGKFIGRLEAVGKVNVLRQKKQFLLSDDDIFCLAFSKNILQAKLHNQMVVLRRYNRTDRREAVTAIIQQIKLLKSKIPGCKQQDEVLGVEGSAARLYFQAVGLLVQPEFAFVGRSRRPPQDPFNALLSSGYAMLQQEVYTASFVNAKVDHLC